MENPLVEGMKERLERARERLLKAQAAFQAAQAEHATALAEFNVWNSAIVLLVKEEEKRLAESKQLNLLPNVPGAGVQPAPTTHTEPINAISATNKTEKVREVLRNAPNGLTASGIWEAAKDHVSSRAYLYAILKRLRDSEEVSLRRGKYVMKPKIAQEVSTNEHVVIQ